MENFFAKMMEIPSLTISAAAEATSLHPQTIRSYEQRGLITPHRTDGGTRMYTYADIMRLNTISSLSHAGVSIEGIQKILEMNDEMDQMMKQMDELMQENIDLRAALSRERRNRRAVSGIISGRPILPSGDGMNSDSE